MPAVRHWLLLIVLAVALTATAQGRAYHIGMAAGHSNAVSAHCLNQKNSAPPAGRHGDCCTLCQLCGLTGVPAAPAQLLNRAAPVTIRLAEFSPTAARSGRLAKSHRARASPIYG
ncbi:DUF2946 family protein [Methylocystis heyeri]|uniref:DUF2946 domain-containing protein n=1 Tax=Methylocystis heyeri TaxID=391905 RepID=A0A6B8KKF7_9HYPH|nr:DUF2946 family protein [Methylocystis heyeri]QGM47150.1 hypothetical protein H2LOC_016420 [Methylocystis heyeri]